MLVRCAPGGSRGLCGTASLLHQTAELAHALRLNTCRSRRRGDRARQARPSGSRVPCRSTRWTRPCGRAWHACRRAASSRRKRRGSTPPPSGRPRAAAAAAARWRPRPRPEAAVPAV
uniref:Uncharacterized protein n=1 Tax=Arundo donax TaxID=35708 RepID=A0A0A9D170_ARUDO